MSDRIFDPMQPIRFGWNTFRDNLQFFVILMMIVGVLYNLPGLIFTTTFTLYGGALQSASPETLLPIFLTMAIVSAVIYMVIELGLLQIALSFRDGKVPDFKDLFEGYPLFLNYLIASIIYGLMVVVGLMLLIVPGIYLGLKYQFYGYAIADNGIGPIDALKESGRMTEGAKQNLLIFWLTLYCGIIVIMLGVLILIGIPIGIITAMISKELLPFFAAASNIISGIASLLVIVPITKLATADIYRILKGRLASSQKSALPEDRTI
ncbi:MAG TPA: hypothetical protein VLB04_03320 [Methanotrichaceae archaeon]|nr:hypothetical protein [Methanotrichaceae archaeon]